MYIWILLASIMVAFSFYNVSPRADKDHALNEIRAATVTNRFKIEHEAMLKMFECEILYQLNSGGWDGSDEDRTSASGPVDVSGFNPGTNPSTEEGADYEAAQKFDDEDATIGSVAIKPSNNNFKKHVPLGYNTTEGKSIFPAGVHHFIYCLDTEVEKVTGAGTENFVPCDTMKSETSSKKTSSRTRYLVTFAQVPEKWLTKTGDRSPLPILTNTLSKEGKSATSYGWTQCKDGKCNFKGKNAVHGNVRHKKDSNHYNPVEDEDGKVTGYEKKNEVGISYDIRVKDNDCEKNEDGSIKINYEEGADGLPVANGCVKKHSMKSDHVYELDQMPTDSVFWENEIFKKLCADQACLFAFEQIPATDTAFHCYNLLVADPANKKSNNYKEKHEKKTTTSTPEGDEGGELSDDEVINPPE